MAAVGLTAAALMTACTVDGTATRGPLKLDTGTFSTSLAPAVGDATEPSALAKLYAMRLGEHVVLRSEVEPSLNKASMPTMPITRPQNLLVVSSEFAKLPVNESLKYGYSIAGSEKNNTDKRGFNHAVLVYPDAQTASAASAASVDSFVKNNSGKPRSVVPVAGMPDGAVVVAGDTTSSKMLSGFLPVGDKLIYTWVEDDDTTRGENTLRTTLTKQRELLEKMPDIESDHRIDPDGLLRATVGKQKDMSTSMDGAVVSPRLLAGYYDDPSDAMSAMTSAGIDRIASDGSLVYRAASEKQAAAWLDYQVSKNEDETTRKSESPQDLPNATCMTSKGSTSFSKESTSCFVSYGRYVAEANSSDATRARQAISASYMKLKAL